MTPPDFSDPASVVAGFIYQMHCWEALAGALRSGAQARFNPDRDSTMHPEEARVSEAVKRVVPRTKSQVIVETFRKADYFGGAREYVVKRQGEVWLIDSVSATVGSKKLKLTLV